MLYAGIGSRETPESVLKLMQEIAAELKKLGYRLCSGGATGADSAFAKGDPDAQIYLPWVGYNGIEKPTMYGPSHEAIHVASTFHPAWHKCGSGAKKLHGRNMHILFGSHLDMPVDFVVCWTKDGKDSGGTGQAIRAAKANNIPVFNLQHTGAVVELNNYLVEKGIVQ